MDSICEIAHRLLMSENLRKYEGCDDVLDLIHRARDLELNSHVLTGQVFVLNRDIQLLKEENKFLLRQINEDANNAAEDV